MWYEQSESEKHSDDLIVEENTGSTASLSKDTKPYEYPPSVVSLSKKGKVEGVLFIFL